MLPIRETRRALHTADQARAEAFEAEAFDPALYAALVAELRRAQAAHRAAVAAQKHGV